MKKMNDVLKMLENAWETAKPYVIKFGEYASFEKMSSKSLKGWLTVTTGILVVNSALKLLVSFSLFGAVTTGLGIWLAYTAYLAYQADKDLPPRHVVRFQRSDDELTMMIHYSDGVSAKIDIGDIGDIEMSPMSTRKVTDFELDHERNKIIFYYNTGDTSSKVLNP